MSVRGYWEYAYVRAEEHFAAAKGIENWGVRKVVHLVVGGLERYVPVVAQVVLLVDLIVSRILGGSGVDGGERNSEWKVEEMEDTDEISDYCSFSSQSDEDNTTGGLFRRQDGEMVENEHYNHEEFLNQKRAESWKRRAKSFFEKQGIDLKKSEIEVCIDEVLEDLAPKEGADLAAARRALRYGIERLGKCDMHDFDHLIQDLTKKPQKTGGCSENQKVKTVDQCIEELKKGLIGIKQCKEAERAAYLQIVGRALKAESSVSPGTFNGYLRTIGIVEEKDYSEAFGCTSKTFKEERGIKRLRDLKCLQLNRWYSLVIKLRQFKAILDIKSCYQKDVGESYQIFLSGLMGVIHEVNWCGPNSEFIRCCEENEAKPINTYFEQLNLIRQREELKAYICQKKCLAFWKHHPELTLSTYVKQNQQALIVPDALYTLGNWVDMHEAQFSQ